MTTVVAYARVSTDRQAENQTIHQQIERLHAFARHQGWQLDADHLYADDGYSGARLDRPALDRLRDAVASGTVDVALITSPDRLARRYAYQVWLLEEFERAGVQVIFPGAATDRRSARRARHPDPWRRRRVRAHRHRRSHASRAADGAACGQARAMDRATVWLSPRSAAAARSGRAAGR
jgi:resolvase-like protein